MQFWKRERGGPLFNLASQYTWVDLYPADQLTIINDLLGKKAGLDSVGVDVFKAAKRRLLNSMLLVKVKESKEFNERLSEEIRNNIDSFVSLTVKFVFVCTFVFFRTLDCTQNLYANT